MGKEEIILRASKVWLGEDGIVQINHFPNSEETLADAKENLASVVKVGKGKRCPLFVDLRNVKSTTREARIFYAGEKSAKAVNAVAGLISSPVSRIIGNFFLGINRPKFPVKLFTSETEAIEWLKGFIE